MIIGFCGVKNIGKDTAASYLIKEYEFQRLSFADKVKESVAASLRIPQHEIEMFKNADNVYVTVGYKNEPTIGGIGADFDTIEEAQIVSNLPSKMWSPISEQTFREFLYHFATEGHRDVFGEDFWLDIALPVDGFYNGRKIVITDVRFQNEVDRINELGGIVCRIRKMDHSMSDEQMHLSEQANLLTGVSYEIWNEGTIEELHGAVEEFVQFLSNPIG